MTKSQKIRYTVERWVTSMVSKCYEDYPVYSEGPVESRSHMHAQRYCCVVSAVILPDLLRDHYLIISATIAVL